MEIFIAFLGSGLISGLFSNPKYLDPGSGSFIIQLLVASAAGILFALRGYWSKILGKFKKSDSQDEEDQE